MSTAISASRARRSDIVRDTDPPTLPHWSVTSPGSEPPRSRLTPHVAGVLRDLLAWAADLAMDWMHDSPDDRAAIAQVRAFADAWLANKPCPELELQDVLTSVAALMSEIDLRLRRADAQLYDTEPSAIGAAIAA